MSETQSLEFRKTINASAAQVYSAFASSIALESWFADFAEVVVSENGRFYAFWNAGHHASGLFTEVDKDKRLVFTWQGRGEPYETQVEVCFEEVGEKTDLRLNHTGLGTSEAWKDSIDAIKSGWEGSLENLVAVFETGLDKRIFDRPMLGIYPGQLIDKDTATEFGVPVNSGVSLTDVVPGLSAESAGMKAKDVIFSINGRELKGYPDFAIGLMGKKAGDVVEVIFYRGADEHSIDMKLCSRPVPEIPESADALAETVAATYAEIDKELDEVFAGVTEAEASVRPSPDNWSAKETLVHLLYTERWLHLTISCVVSGQRSGGFANELRLIGAMADAYTLEGLLATLKQAEKVTVASLAALPLEFMNDKRKFIGFVTSSGQGFANHTRTHIPQIIEAIEAAREF